MLEIGFSFPLHLLFDMRRRQFLVRLAFGMTINKSQGQTMPILGLYSATLVFSHGKLYVAFSRVRSSDAVKVFLQEDVDEANFGVSKMVCTTNVVFKEVLQMAANGV